MGRTEAVSGQGGHGGPGLQPDWDKTFQLEYFFEEKQVRINLKNQASLIKKSQTNQRFDFPVGLGRKLTLLFVNHQILEI